MNYLFRFTFLSTLSLLFILNRDSFAWSHIELGASNYASNLAADHTRTSKQVDVEAQNKLLFDTVDRLIIEHGESEEGTFYVNDLDEANVEYTIDKLKKYVQLKHPTSKLKIESLPGDFFKIDLPHVDSIHLKNPEYWFFQSLDKTENKNRLKYFSDCANQGLTLITYFKRPFIHRLNELEVGYKVINPEFPPYVHGDGSTVIKYGNVVEFLVKSVNTIKAENNISEFVTATNSSEKIGNMFEDIFGSGFTFRQFTEDFVDPEYLPLCTAPSISE